MWAKASYRFDFIVGEEISTNEGHLLALFIEKHVPPPVLDRIHANKDLWLDGIETWNAGLCGLYTNRISMRTNRQRYGWSEVGNSDAHTLNGIGRACTLFQGSTALDVRTAIQSGLSTPVGKLWNVNDFIALAGHQINKRRLARKQSAA